jgi:hypothetical protein
MHQLHAFLPIEHAKVSLRGEIAGYYGEIVVNLPEKNARSSFRAMLKLHDGQMVIPPRNEVLPCRLCLCPGVGVTTPRSAPKNEPPQRWRISDRLVLLHVVDSNL